MRGLGEIDSHASPRTLAQSRVFFIIHQDKTTVRAQSTNTCSIYDSLWSPCVLHRKKTWRTFCKTNMQASTGFHKDDYVMYTNTTGTAQCLGIVLGLVSECYVDRNQYRVQIIARRVHPDAPFVRTGKQAIIVKPERLYLIDKNDYAYVLRPPLHVDTEVWYHGEGGIKHYGKIVAEQYPYLHGSVHGDRLFIVEVRTTKYPYHQDFRTPIDRFVSCYESQLHEVFVIW